MYETFPRLWLGEVLLHGTFDVDSVVIVVWWFCVNLHKIKRYGYHVVVVIVMIGARYVVPRCRNPLVATSEVVVDPYCLYSF